jgi:hypothetical protein
VLFAIGYSSVWAIVHFCCNTSTWSGFVVFTATQIVPLVVGTMFASGYDYIFKGGSNG